MEIAVHGGFTATVDDADAPRVMRYKWHLCNGYAARSYRENGTVKTQYLHHCILGGFALVDHEDRNRLNNRRKNLRSATQSQNSANSVRVNRKTISTLKGTRYDKRRHKWEARLGFQGKRLNLGYFLTEQEAADAYDVAAKAAFGDYARINSI
jgi:hypothetical protein